MPVELDKIGCHARDPRERSMAAALIEIRTARRRSDGPCSCRWLVRFLAAPPRSCTAKHGNSLRMCPARMIGQPYRLRQTGKGSRSGRLRLTRASGNIPGLYRGG